MKRKLKIFGITSLLIVTMAGCASFYQWLSESSPKDELSRRRQVEKALTLIRNEDGQLPIKRLDSTSFAVLSLSHQPLNFFDEALHFYTDFASFWISHESTDSIARVTAEKLKAYDQLIIGLEPPISPLMLRTVRALVSNEGQKTTLVFFGTEDDIDTEYFPLASFESVLISYNAYEITQSLSAQLIFGGISAKGQLSTNLGTQYPEDFGLTTPDPIRLKYTIPEEVGLKTKKLTEIDRIAAESIREQATPGCQVLVAQQGKVIYHKAFGFHTYDSVRPVRRTDLYDLASVTKVTSALPALMRGQGEGWFDIEKTLGDYLPELRETNKSDLIIKEVLAHQARLQAYFLYWEEDQKEGKLEAYLSDKKTEKHSLQVAEDLFVDPKYKKERIVQRIADSRLRREAKYKYSGLAFLLWPDVVESLTKQEYSDYLKETFYQPLGATSIGFLPLERFPKDQIVPTENDKVFRKQQLHGFVHDDAAAMLGGVSANAGLFSNANDLAKILQMYLQGGSYGGKKYINTDALDLFTKRHFAENENRRGLGFDKPFLKDADINGNTAPSASPSSYGHSGYTGTFAWVDPEYDLIYIFLANRVYPTRENTALFKLNTRTRIQEVIYQAIKKAK
ncbi:MAG: serine hydrolase [Bacteroidota bacterium]